MSSARKKTVAPAAPVARDPLSRNRILETAVVVLDQEGLDALTMRRLATELGVEAMSLYRHVANKAALLDGVHERILGELQLGSRERDENWAAAIGSYARAFRKVLRAHPNALPLFATRPAVAPASLRHVERGLRVLRGAGFTIGEAISAFQTLVTFVVGHTLSTDGAPTDDRSAVAYEQLPAAEFPTLREAARVIAQHSVDKEFEFGLDVLLRGLGERLKAVSPSRRGSA
jgi:AcrR family transcriptional regulator